MAKTVTLLHIKGKKKKKKKKKKKEVEHLCSLFAQFQHLRAPVLNQQLPRDHPHHTNPSRGQGQTEPGQERRSTQHVLLGAVSAHFQSAQYTAYHSSISAGKQMSSIRDGLALKHQFTYLSCYTTLFNKRRLPIGNSCLVEESAPLSCGQKPTTEFCSI